ncbi:MAG: glutaredoxin domain-containing protein [Actinomycetota bacterium]
MIVTLLTKHNCDSCVRAKEILDHLGAEVSFELRIVDLEDPTGQALAAEHGILFAPGVLIDGRLSTFGRPSERRLRRDLTSAKRAS